MATTKQLNMLSAKARAANMNFDRTAAIELDNGAITELVKKFDANGGKQEKTVKAENVDAVAEINGARFGMVYKVVIDKVGHAWKAENVTEFINYVVDEYRIATLADAAVNLDVGGK